MVKGEFTKFVDNVKKLVERGELSKEDAVIITLNKVSEVFSGMQLDTEQFMKDQMFNSQEVS